MKLLFEAIKSQLQATVWQNPPFSTTFDPGFEGTAPVEVYLWNNQLESIRSKRVESEDGGNMTYAMNYPCVLVEFTNLEREQMGGGYQIFPDLKVRLHLLYREEDAGDGTQDENLEIDLFRNVIQRSMQKFQTQYSGIFIAENDEPDTKHDAIYHMVVRYGTTWIQDIMAEPINGAAKAGGTVTPGISLSYNPKPFLKPS